MTVEELIVKIKADTSDATTKIEKLKKVINNSINEAEEYSQSLQGMRQYINARNSYLKNSAEMEVKEREKAAKHIDELARKYSEKYGKIWEDVFNKYLEAEDTTGIEKEMHDIVSAAEEAKDSIAKTDKETKKTGKSAEKAGLSFKKFLKFGLAVAGVRTAAMAVRKAFLLVFDAIKSCINKIKEFTNAGMENLYAWDTQKGSGSFVKAMDALTSKLEAIKNSMAGIFANIVIAAEPYLTDIMLKVTEFFNNISELIAKLMGKSTFYKANTEILKKWKDVNNETEDVTEEQEENIEALGKLISGLDTLNILDLGDSKNTIAQPANKEPEESAIEEFFTEEKVGEDVSILKSIETKWTEIKDAVVKFKDEFLIEFVNKVKWLAQYLYYVFKKDEEKLKLMPQIGESEEDYQNRIAQKLSMYQTLSNGAGRYPTDVEKKLMNSYEEDLEFMADSANKLFGMNITIPSRKEMRTGDYSYNGAPTWENNFIIPEPVFGANADADKLKKILGIPNANGGVYTQPTLGLVGEYAGATSNPEIISPQSIMQDTMEQANMNVVNTLIQCTRQLIDSINSKDVSVNIDSNNFGRAMQQANRNYYNAAGVNLI